jgi:hypothetical protein
MATITSCVSASDDLIDDIDLEIDPKTLVTSGGSIYASVNTTYITYILIGIAGIAALGGVFYYLSTTDALPLPKQGQNYYDPNADLASDAALEYAAATVQNTNTSQDYRRKRSTYEQSKL